MIVGKCYGALCAWARCVYAFFPGGMLAIFTNSIGRGGALPTALGRHWCVVACLCRWRRSSVWEACDCLGRQCDLLLVAVSCMTVMRFCAHQRLVQCFRLSAFSIAIFCFGAIKMAEEADFPTLAEFCVNIDFDGADAAFIADVTELLRHNDVTVSGLLCMRARCRVSRYFCCAFSARALRRFRFPCWDWSQYV